MRPDSRIVPVAVLTAATFLSGCDVPPPSPTEAAPPVRALAHGGGGPAAAIAGPWSFAPPVFDIATAPNGDVLVPETVFPYPGGAGTETTIVAVGRKGMSEFATVTTEPGSPINGIEMVGRGHAWVTSGGKDAAEGAAVWKVTPGQVRMVGDITAFEVAHDPDVEVWKNPACEADPPVYSAGPQSNPYHLTMVDDERALVADAAGNAVLMVEEGEVDWVAVPTPPTGSGGASNDPADWAVLFSAGELTCYVQPVPTSVAVGPDGYYFGELTGAPATPGLSRVWRVDPGAQHAVCPGDHCEMVMGGFTSIVDVAFGPDGYLYVVEMDEASWLASVGVVPAEGGTLNRCDPDTWSCTAVGGEGAYTFPGAVAFDKWGTLWMLENGLGSPTVSAVSMP